jgi:hypothetical protein
MPKKYGRAKKIMHTIILATGMTLAAPSVAIDGELHITWKKQSETVKPPMSCPSVHRFKPPAKHPQHHHKSASRAPKHPTHVSGDVDLKIHASFGPNDGKDQKDARHQTRPNKTKGRSTRRWRR